MKATHSKGVQIPDRRLDERIGDAFCAHGLITAEQLAHALTLQRDSCPEKRIGAILVDLRLVAEEDVVRVLADQIGTPFVHLSSNMVGRDAAQSLSADFLEKHNLLPLSREEGWLTIAIEDFTDVFLIEEIAKLSQCKVQAIAATPANIRQIRQSVLRAVPRGASGSGAASTDGLDEILGQINTDELRIVEAAPEDDAALEAPAADSPVVALVNHIIKTAVQASASDIHIEPSETTFRVRQRVDGDLATTIRPSNRLLPAVVSRIKILAGMDISQRRLPQDGGVTVTLFDRAVDLRISTMAAKFGEKVVIRIVDRDSGRRTLEDIGMLPAMVSRFRAVVREPNGIVLVTGPTGSGKSTTLYSAIAEIVTDDSNISTIEDPIERVLSGVNQFQVHPKAGFTFASALRAMLRQDPDIIMVGEIRDPETAKLATEAALTGHLVLSTLHTNDAPASIPRLINMGIEPYLVAATLRGALAQRLVRKVCPSCARPVKATPAQADTIRVLSQGKRTIEKAFAAEGCAECSGSGHRGRIGIFDLMVLDDSAAAAIERGGERQNGGGAGFAGLLSDGLDKVHHGQITVPSLLEILSRINDTGLAAAA